MHVLFAFNFQILTVINVIHYTVFYGHTIFKGSLYVHPLGCTLYVVLRLQESVCQKDKEKNRRTRTDSLNGRALYNWVQPCRGILKIYAEYFAFFPLIVCLNSHNPLRAKCGLDHETASRTDRGNTLAHAPNRPIKDDLLNELARKAG